MNPLIAQLVQTAFQAGIDIAKRHYKETGQMLTDEQAAAMKYKELDAGYAGLKARLAELGIPWPD